MFFCCVFSEKFDILYYMKSIRLVAIFFAMSALFFQTGIALASNISGTEKYSQFLDLDLDTDSVKDIINWRPSTPGTGATVTDTAITGTIWGESVGWINLGPFANNSGPTAGVKNTCDGNLSGYAWGQNTGWINFGPFVNSSSTSTVRIDTNTGQFNGYAWAQNYGWINFDCSDSNSCVTTTWDGCVVDDVCPNIAGDQATVPSGYVLDSGLCVLEPECEDCITGTNDLCKNIDGIQPTVADIPAGHYRDGDGNCYPNQPDFCLNINGIQSSVPIGLIRDIYGNCNPRIYECSDGIDNDGDGYIDFGNIEGEYDSGCNSDIDDNEYGDWCATLPGQQQIWDDCPIDNNQLCPGGSGLTYAEWEEQDPYFNYVDSYTGECKSYEETKVCFNLFEGGLDSIPDGYRGTDENDRTCVIDNTDQTILGFLEKDLFGKLAPIIGIIGLLSTIPGFATRILNLILSIPFYRRRRPWGIVYDSQTKETLDPAYVTVYNADTNQLVDTRITDINGRYGFLLPKGNYRIEAQKTHYIFPSVLLPRQSSDGVYDNLYFGEVFSVTDENKNAVITLNIPMDRLATDWNQEEKKRLGIMRVFTHNTKLWSTISMILFIAGFIFSAFVLTIDQSTWNIIVFCLYVLFTILQLVGYGPVRSGYITDKFGKPIAHAVVRVWNAHLGTEIAKRITDDKGQYYLLIARGDYYVTIDVKNASGGYDRVMTSGTIRAMQGVINESYKI